MLGSGGNAPLAADNMCSCSCGGGQHHLWEKDDCDQCLGDCSSLCGDHSASCCLKDFWNQRDDYLSGCDDNEVTGKEDSDCHTCQSGKVPNDEQSECVVPCASHEIGVGENAECEACPIQTMNKTIAQSVRITKSQESKMLNAPTGLFRASTKVTASVVMRMNLQLTC